MRFSHSLRVKIKEKADTVTGMITRMAVKSIADIEKKGAFGTIPYCTLFFKNIIY